MGDSKLRRLRDTRSGAATLINEGCKIRGEIGGHGDFLINGEVEGDCDVDGTVTLAPDGHWSGTIRANNVIVAGHVDGSIAAKGKVEITNSARITGKVSGDAIAVAEGAVVEGEMKTNSQASPITFVEKREQ